MINLLPEQYEETARRDYCRRRRVVAGSLVFICLITAALVLSSGYVMLRSERVSTEKLLESKRAEIVAGESSLSSASLSALLADASALGVMEESRVLPMVYLEHVLADKPVGVSVKSLLFSRATDGKNLRLELSGQAFSRRALLTFLDQLRADKLFSAVDSPVSNLIKESNIPFNLSLNLNPHE